MNNLKVVRGKNARGIETWTVCNGETIVSGPYTCPVSLSWGVYRPGMAPQQTVRIAHTDGKMEELFLSL